MPEPQNSSELGDVVKRLLEIWESQAPPSDSTALSAEESLPYDYAETGGRLAATLDAPNPPQKHATIVAEGDSWFDYPIKGDLLDVLRKTHGYVVHEVSRAGALLEDMVYGSERNYWGREKPQIIRTMDLVARVKPTIVLISGGGNDIAGDELPAYINRKAPGVERLRDGSVDHLVFTVFRRAYEVFIKSIQNVAERGGFEVTVIGHTYDFPNPDGRGYSLTGLIPGFSYVGPWLKPALTLKGYGEEEGREIIKQFLEKFANLHEQLTQQFNGKFQTAKLQGTLDPLKTSDWEDEMHPTWSGFTRLGQKVHDTIQKV